MSKVFSTSHLNTVFSQVDFTSFENLMFDLADKKEIFDSTTNRKISNQEANDKLRFVVFNILGINERSTKKERKRALKRHGYELFEVIEEVIDRNISTGFKDNEFFNQFVDMRNIADGDSQEFWVENDMILAVAKVAGDHHDYILQTFGEGESYTVPTSVYEVSIGTDIDLYLTGRKDWAAMIDAVSRAFMAQIQNDLYTEVMNAGSKIPASSQFTKTMALTATNKGTFDTLIEDVSTANDNVPVCIMGTKTALKKITALADVDWADATQKEAVSNTGRLGSYEGTLLIEIPQRFANNDTSKKLVDSTKLLIMPMVDNKFVKFVDVGETEIFEQTEKGDRMDDTMKYEVQRQMGIATQIGRYFGVWTISS